MASGFTDNPEVGLGLRSATRSRLGSLVTGNEHPSCIASKSPAIRKLGLRKTVFGNVNLAASLQLFKLSHTNSQAGSASYEALLSDRGELLPGA